MTLRDRLNELEESFKGLAEAIEAELKPSILKGKVAIQVNNEREFKLLMEHYESKGFKTFNNNCNSKLFLDTYNITSKNGMLITHVAYGDGYGHSQAGYYDVHGYKIIPFADFALEMDIIAPVKIMVSEDGVDLYEGDNYCAAYKGVGDRWALASFRNDCIYRIYSDSLCLESERFFSTKEAAEKWIEEQNRPKYKTVELFTGMEAHVYTGEIHIKDADRTVTTLMPSDIEDIAHAISQLNCDKTTDQ